MTNKNTYNRLLFSHKKNEIMPLAPTWRDLEVVKLSKSDRERQIKDITSIWNLKTMVQMNSFTKQK